MKRNIYLMICFIVVLCANNIWAQYYYSDNRQIPLLIDSTKITILFDAPYSQDFINDFMEYYERIDSQITEEYAYDSYEIFAINNGNNLEEFIDTLYLDQRVSKVNPYYLIGPETPSLVGKTICCKFNDTMTYSAIDSINQLYGVDIVNEKTVQPKEFLLSVNDNSPYNTLDLANIYYEMDCVEYSHPNFYGSYRLDAYQMYDHYGPEQWAMHRVFGISPESTSHKAFEITTGSSDIIVAVIDAALMEHEDINSSNFYGGYDFINNDPYPTPCGFSGGNTAHGISVAGIIFGQHNRDSSLQSDRNTGIYGIAPDCKIMPLKITSGYPYWTANTDCTPCWASDAGVADAIDYAWYNGADILSCSWARMYEMVDALTVAVVRAATLGRGGKGSALFYSAGNDGRRYGENYIVWPQMMDQVLTVGAIDTKDSIRFYSNYGKIDVVAPSGDGYKINYEEGIWTTDLPDNMGYVFSGGQYACGDRLDLDYMCVFSGTSASQPVAAGVGALLLSARPDLTRLQLYNVIRNSADPNLAITITHPPDEKYGYGMVHPMRALLAVSRGDANNDHNIDILDILYLIDFVYNSGPEPTPHPLMGDANGSGSVNLMDMLYLISYLYDNPPGPPPPISFNYGEYEF